MAWLDLLVVQGTLKSLLQHHRSKASILWHSAFFTVQLSHPFMTTEKTIALTRRTFVDKVMSLLFNMLTEALNNQWYGWIGLRGSYYDWKMPFLITIMELWKNKSLLLWRSGNYRAHPGPHYEVMKKERHRDMEREKEREWASVQSLSRVWLFETPWTAARQASLSITNSWSLLKLMSTESVMPSNHLILCCPLFLLPSIFPATGSFLMSQFFASGGQSIGVSALASVLPMSTQD